MPIFSFCAQASFENGLSTLTPMTSAPEPLYCCNPAVTSHISLVQTLVNASGKNNTTVFVFPKLLLNFTSTNPLACFDFSVKSGAFVPTGIAIFKSLFSILSFQACRYRHLRPTCQRDTLMSWSPKCPLTTHNSHQKPSRSYFLLLRLLQIRESS